MNDVQEIVASVRSYDGAADTALIERSFAFAAERHAGQKRRSGDPYVIHPVGVARIIAELRLDVPSVCAGLLHDCVEDTRATAEEHRPSCSAPRSRSSSTASPSSARSRARRARSSQAENFRKMLLAMARDIRVILVKLCDRLDNMRTLDAHAAREAGAHRRARRCEIYAPLANRLGIQWIKSELEDLAFKYLDPDEYEQLVARRSRRPRRARASYIARSSRRCIGRS